MNAHHMGHRIKSKLNPAPAPCTYSFFVENPPGSGNRKRIIQVGEDNKSRQASKSNCVHPIDLREQTDLCPDLVGEDMSRERVTS